ncbi:class I SAM-dependent methyltransferase [Allorhizobium sp. BGMRC 0089]|uniref:class I SAM-dependent methyltransferase n=1 Tax=Allorhizobium sonneratiae TaxID=2934936 RepID=UPI002033B334|nr:class I SAM-dependent methyltransferase [Allorhizobium sonneratiae]MCM2292948.1 class I SAM-dependent methyltransferase [Allorhizobium sonneratiae]
MQTPTDRQFSQDASHDQNVRSQFGSKSASYVTSQVHATGVDLAALSEMSQMLRPQNALDLGCGGGHVSYTLAPHCTQVTAVDLSDDMLAAVQTAAQEKGFDNLNTVKASASSLPFDDGHFDFLACRYTTHHWHQAEAGLREAHRVLKPGSKAVFIDVVAPAHPLLDTHLQAIELLRDTSHVRNYRLSEWGAMLERSGFIEESLMRFRVKMEFDVWTARMRTPPHLVAAIRALQQAASKDVTRHFAIEADGSFMLDMAMITVIAG